jgi:hypothetical protein
MAYTLHSRAKIQNKSMRFTKRRLRKARNAMALLAYARTMEINITEDFSLIRVEINLKPCSTTWASSTIALSCKSRLLSTGFEQIVQIAVGCRSTLLDVPWDERLRKMNLLPQSTFTSDWSNNITITLSLKLINYDSISMLDNNTYTVPPVL